MNQERRTNPRETTSENRVNQTLQDGVVHIHTSHILMKYRRLTQLELESLEKEFIDFLILNGITAEDWTELKLTKEKANQIIDSFSDVVFEKILRQINYLEHYSPQSIKTFMCADDEIFLIGLDTHDRSIDFTTSVGRSRLVIDPPKDLNTYKTSKKYHPNREIELFRMLQNGCVKSDGQLYESLKMQWEAETPKE